MKRFVIIFISLIVGYALYWCISDYYYKKGKERCIVGKYKLDIHRTNLGICKKKVEKYKGLILTFNADLCHERFWQSIPAKTIVHVIEDAFLATTKIVEFHDVPCT